MQAPGQRQCSTFASSPIKVEEDQWLENTLKIATGEKPDISSCMEFTFWPKLLYLNYDESFPDTIMRSGCFLAVLRILEIP